MSRHGIRKGKTGEREIVQHLQDAVDSVYLLRGLTSPEIKRSSYKQSNNGGCDIEGLPWLAIEVKRHENLSHLGTWWEQAKSQATQGQTPVLVYRQNGKPWRVRMVSLLQVKGNRMLRTLADINLATFLTWVRLRCEAEIANGVGVS